MAALTYQLRAELRRSWRGAVVLALLLALIGGAVLASTAGARRTASAYPRLLSGTNAEEILASPSTPDPEAIYEHIAALPGVRSTGVMAGLPVLAMEGTPTGDLMEGSPNTEITPFGMPMATVDGAALRDIGRPAITEGRMPGPDRVDEVLVSRRVSRSADLSVGDRLDFVLAPEHPDDAITADESMGRHLPVTVVGIGEFPSEVVPFSDLEATGTMMFSEAVAALIPRDEYYFEGMLIDVEPGTDTAALVETIEGLGDHPDAGGPLFVVDRSANAAEVTDGLRPLAVALAAFAVVLGIAGTFVVGQAAARHVRPVPADAVARAAIGMTRRERLGLGVARAGAIAVTGALGAALVAVLLSDRFPIGPARLAETDPGLRIDAPVIVLGTVAIVVLVIVSVLPSLLLGLRGQAAERPRTSRLGTWVANLGASPAAAQGVRLAVGQPGRGRRTPARSTIVATAVAIASVMAAATFASSLTTLVDSPERFGQNWDRLVDGEFGPAPAALVVERLAEDDDIEGMAVGSFHHTTIDGRLVPTISMRTLSGDTTTSILRGRPASAPGEIALGGEVLDELGVDIGGRVEVVDDSGNRTLEIVGEAVFPHFNQGSFGQTGLGFGAQVSADELEIFLSPEDREEVPPGYELDGAFYNFVAIDVAGSGDAIDATLDEIQREVLFPVLVRAEQRPTTIADLDRVRSVPVALAVILALSAAALVAHLLVSAVRSHRRELGLLSALGFTRRQLRSTVSWQATLVMLLACAVGIPTGVAVGRLLWRSFAESIHAPSSPVVPVLWVVLAVPVALLLANAVAAVPGRLAARARPAVTLRED